MGSIYGTSSHTYMESKTAISPATLSKSGRFPPLKDAPRCPADIPKQSVELKASCLIAISEVRDLPPPRLRVLRVLRVRGLRVRVGIRVHV